MFQSRRRRLRDAQAGELEGGGGAAQLDATPLAAGIASTGFNTTVSGAGHQANATTAGTYYAKKANATATQCTAAYPQNAGAAFNWGTSYSSAGVN